MSKIKVTVTKVSDKTENNSYIHTLKSEGKEVDFMGTKMQGAGLTYFVALANPLAVDTTDTIDLAKFDVVERVTELESAKTGELETFTFKWLYPKR